LSTNKTADAALECFDACLAALDSDAPGSAGSDSAAPSSADAAPLLRTRARAGRALCAALAEACADPQLRFGATVQRASDAARAAAAEIAAFQLPRQDKSVPRALRGVVAEDAAGAESCVGKTSSDIFN
jgi:hypothetical protein